MKGWFDAEPWLTARGLLEKLQAEHPVIYPDRLLRLSVYDAERGETVTGRGASK